MKPLFWLFTLLFVSHFTAPAQNNLPPTFEIKADTAITQMLDDRYWQMLEDPSNKFTINQVSSADFSTKFHRNTTRKKGINYAISTYWFRYRLKNVLNRPVTLALQENSAYVWLYIPKANAKWTVQTSGTMVPWSKRDGLKLFRHLTLTIAPGQEILLYEKNRLDFTQKKARYFQINIGFEGPVIRAYYTQNYSLYTKNMIFGALIGILLIAGLINLFFYTVVREKTYLYFAIYLILQSLSNFNRMPESWLSEYPHVRWHINYAIVVSLYFMLMHFIRLFLSTAIHTPKWDKFLILLSFLLLGGCFWWHFLPPYASMATYLASSLLLNLIINIYLPVILATMLLYIRRTKGTVRLGMIAIIPALVWVGIGSNFIGTYQTMHQVFNIPYSKFYLWLSSIITETSSIEVLCFLWLVIVFSWLLFKRFRDIQQKLIQDKLDVEVERSQLIEKQNSELEQQVEARTAELNQSLTNLKTTQSQLIQSEKMASLGELTAGIAHEIQNPLNFVNNFSEVSVELLDELKEEMEAGNKADVLAIADDLTLNLQKINHHGKRADFIVKGMLQHSRTSTGERQLTNINILADEFLKLSYHGLRAKDKNFNAELITNFDEALPKINIVQQEIGRVLLNLFNNAFYAVNEKKKMAGVDYKPEVIVTTIAENNEIAISVRDNGIGIPNTIKEKIIQPFFTTKPTGEGTGLGLSLSYDIVVKGHGGTIDIDSKENEYTNFMVRIPK